MTGVQTCALPILLNQQINYEVSEAPNFRQAAHSVEILSFLWKGEAVHLSVYDRDDLRHSGKGSRQKRVERADIAAVKSLLTEHDKK